MIRLVVIAFLLGLLMGWLATGTYKDAIHGAEISDLLRDQAEAMTLAHQERQRLADKIARLDADGIRRLQDAQNENDRLAAAVRDGAVRLRVAATCPAVPGAPAGAGVGDAAVPELAPDARPDYHALREGIVLKESQLTTCQAILAAERNGPKTKEVELGGTTQN